MFYCWHKKNMKPSEFKSLSLGEKVIIKAFAYKELEIEEKKNKKGV